MNYNEWSNYTCRGYVKFALEDYNRIATKSENDYRTLTPEEVQKILGCLYYAFDMKTLKEAYDKG